MASIFSKIVAGDIPSYKIAETDRYYAFLDIRPVTKGHTLVIPKQETDDFFDLEDELLAGLMVFAKQVAKAIEKHCPCKRVGIAVIGLEVPHAHVHLIPILENGVTDFDFSKRRVKLTKAEYQTLAEDIYATWAAMQA